MIGAAQRAKNLYNLKFYFLESVMRFSRLLKIENLYRYYVNMCCLPSPFLVARALGSPYLAAPATATNKKFSAPDLHESA